MIEIADIFRQYSGDYQARHQLSHPMIKAIHAIKACRTSELGGHVDQCDDCGHMKISYNSCRNRHCPKCQSISKEKWLENRKRDLLDIPYYHVVFTIPRELNELVLQNQKQMYTALFKASSETLLELAEEPKYLGAQIGFLSILHTWGQNLMEHPHIHCIVTGDGLTKGEGGCWKSCRKNFFIPVRVMSRLFRGKFMFYLNLARKQKQLKFFGSIASLLEENSYTSLQKQLKAKEWVVYCKPPFQSPKHVLTYLGRYTHRVAISNHRIIKVKEGKVLFKWRDYKDKNRNKTMTLDAFEFMRRFLLHILPHRFVKIRHYGILSNRNRATKLNQCKLMLNKTSKSLSILIIKENWSEFLLRITGIDHMLCPKCKKGTMSLFAELKSLNCLRLIRVPEKF